MTVAAETSGFLYLYLAGTEQTTGVQSPDGRAVDIVYKNADNSFQNVSTQNHVPKRTRLKIVGTYNGVGELITYSQLKIPDRKNTSSTTSLATFDFVLWRIDPII